MILSRLIELDKTKQNYVVLLKSGEDRDLSLRPGWLTPIADTEQFIVWSVFTVSCIKTFDSVTHIWIMLLADY